MKERHGFVSNSSSSSFIIGIANATQAGRDDVGEVFDDSRLEFNKWYNTFVTGLGEKNEGWIKVKPLEDGTYRLTVDSFNDLDVSCIAKNGDKIVALDYAGNEGDSSFMVDDYDLDYDIGLDFFEEDIQKQYDLINELGGQTYYGAARNG